MQKTHHFPVILTGYFSDPFYGVLTADIFSES